MADNVRAGMNYEINLSGNIEKKIVALEARIKQLKANASRAVKSSPRDSKAEQASSQALARQEAILKKMKSLTNQIYLTNNRSLAAIEARTKALKAQQRTLVGIQTLRKQEYVEHLANDKVIQRKQAREVSRLATLKEINREIASGVSSPTQIGQNLGLSAERVAAVKPELQAVLALEKQRKVEAQAAARARETELRKLAAMKSQLAKVKEESQKYGISMARAADRLGLSVAEARRLGIQMSHVERMARQFLFTFRRLVGILAVFTLARKFAQFIGAAVTEMSRFNSVLETTRISFASLISATGQIIDNQGNLLDGQDAFNAALELSDQLILDLRKDALSTVATFEDLLNSFTVAAGPGLSAGLNLDEVRQTAVNIAKAATTLQVPTNQLSEEVRSLINGTIRLNNTRLAAIGITNNQIRLAREEGRLFEFLNESLAAFAVASDSVAKSYEGLKSQVRDTISSLLAEGSLQYFQELKATLSDLVLVLRDTDGEGGFELSPEAVDGVRQFSLGLSSIINDFRELSSARTALAGFNGTLTSIGTALQTISTIFTPILTGILQGLAAVTAITGLVGKLVVFIKNLLPKPILRTLQLILSTITAIVTATLVWNGLVTLAGVLWGKILGSQVLVQAAQTIINTLTELWTIWVLLVNGRLTFTAAVMAAIQALAGGIGLALAAIGAIIGVAAVSLGLISRATKRIASDMEGIKDSASDIEESTRLTTNNVIAQSSAVKALQEEYDKVLNKIEQAQRALDLERLTSGLLGSSGQFISTFAKGLDPYNKQVQDVRKELERVKAEIENLPEVQIRIAPISEIFADVDSFTKQLGEAISDIEPEDPDTIKQLSDDERKQIEVDFKRVALLERQKGLEEALETIQKARAEQTRIELERLNLKNRERQDELQILKNQQDTFNSIANDVRSTFSDAFVNAQNAMFAVTEAALQLSAAQDAQEEVAKNRASEFKRLLSEFPELGETGVNNELEKQAELQSTKVRSLEQELTRLYAELAFYQALEENDLARSFTYGLAEWKRSVDTLGETLYDIAAELPNAFSEAVSSTAVDALRGEDVDEREVAVDLLAQVLEQLLASMINNFISLVLSNELLRTIIGTAATKQATSAEILALSVDGLSVKIGELVGSIAGLILAIEKDTASRAGSSIAGAASSGSHYGGRVGYVRGGRVKSYEKGGGVSDFPRPSGIHPSDTVRAWLTPGEHVMTNKATNMLGHGFFDTINKMASNSAVFGSRLAASRAMSPVIGKADGGAIATGRVSSIDNLSSPQNNQTVLPILVVDDSVGQQIYTGSRDAFSTEMFKQQQDNPNRSGFA